MPIAETTSNATSVSAAFEMLLEEIEADIDVVNHQGSRAFERRDYDAARDVLERVAKITAFREKLDTLRREWHQIAGSPDVDDEETQTHRRDLGRLQRGQRTPEQEYYVPILRALDDLGGSAPLGDVLDRVHEMMRDILRDVDFQPLASDPALPRWRNAAQWARNSMCREGLLKNDSPRGIWEISEAGRRYLMET
ncbi:MAG: hypothetical protein KatS3mg105_5093 [Gemmatales bacterium]|nr:MAG: hypothetical protein KatS3mg105_5093 [Gemmatales bacterium]